MIDLPHIVYGWGALVFVAWGLAVGSFLNVLITRLPLGYLLTAPRRSACTGCYRKLCWYENIPVLSYLFLRGKCSGCKSSIGLLHPLVELMTAAIFAAVYLNWGPTLQSVAYAYFAASLVAMTFIDLKYRIIPDEISIGGIFVGLIAAAFIARGAPYASIFGALIGGGFFWMLAWTYERVTGREGLGFGDVKLLAMIGAFLGPQGVLGTIFLSSVLGSIVGGALIVCKRGGMKTAVPYGPFLAVAALIMLFWGDHLYYYLYPQ